METEAIEKVSTVIPTLWAEAEEENTETTENAATEETESEETSASDQSEGSEESGEHADGETESEEESSTEETSEESESEDGPALPKKQAKSYDKALTDHYASRFGWTPEEIEKDKTKAYAVKKAIDSDIFIAQQNERLSALESEPEAEEEEVPETKPETETAHEPTPEERAVYRENLQKFTKELNDPEMLKSFANDYAQSMGFKDAAAFQKATNVDPVVFAEKSSMAMVNLINTALPRLMPAYLQAAVEAVFPGFGRMFDEATNANAWDDLRAADFKDLPQYGSADFSKAYKDVVKANPWVEQIELVDRKTNRPLSRQQAVATRYRIVAQLLSGQKVTPQTVQDAVNRGKQDAARNNRKVSAGRSLGAGKSTGNIAPAKKENSLIAAYKAKNGGSFGE